MTDTTTPQVWDWQLTAGQLADVLKNVPSDWIIELGWNGDPVTGNPIPQCVRVEPSKRKVYILAGGIADG